MIFPLKHSPFWNDFPFKNKSSIARSPTEVNMQVAPNLAIPSDTHQFSSTRKIKMSENPRHLAHPRFHKNPRKFP
jgi:hypothetical protein